MAFLRHESVNESEMQQVLIYALVLHDSNPSRHLSIAGAQPDIVACREANLHGEVRTNSIGILEFFGKIIAEFTQASLCVFKGYRPFRSMLWILHVRGTLISIHLYGVKKSHRCLPGNPH